MNALHHETVTVLFFMHTELRWLKTVSSIFQDLDFDGSYYNHSILVDAKIMVSKSCWSVVIGRLEESCKQRQLI